jgi:DNA polymerase-4
MDCFYAAIHMRDEPSLRGKPVAVGGRPEGRGVVAAASYEIRKFGVRSAMPAARAQRLCPEAIFIRPDFPRYRRESAEIFRIFADYTDLVQPVSIDEAYLDCSAHLAGFGSATGIARDIRRRVREERGLTVSIGVGPNRLIAKIASDANKPDGLTVVKPSQAERFIAPLDVRALPGVGPVMQKRLERGGVTKIGQLRELSNEKLRRLAGSFGDTLHRYCRGQDDRPVRVSRERKSLSSERTYEEDLDVIEEMDTEVERLAAEVAQGLERRELSACTVTVKVRYEDFTTVTRSRSFPSPICSATVMAAHAKALLRRTAAGKRKVRLLGVGASNLVLGGVEQLSLFVDLGGGQSPRAAE